MRYAARVDRNQSAIVEDLRLAGYDVDIVSREKKMYDIVVSGFAVWATRPVAVRVEIKTEGGTLTPDEATYWARQRWKGNLIRATCAEDVIKWFMEA